MICVALSDTDFNKCLELVHKFELCEIRLDMTRFDKKQIEKIFSSGAKLIATYRPGNISEEDRKELLKLANDNSLSLLKSTLERYFVKTD